MTVYELTAILLGVSFLAGFLGSLTGLGGGVVIVPVLTLLFHVDIRYAIGASLVSVIATSSGAAAAYVREGYSNIRIGMFLEVATCAGAIVGALIAAYVSASLIGLVFGGVLIYSAYLSLVRIEHGHSAKGRHDVLSEKLRLGGTYPGRRRHIPYRARRVLAGFGVMGIAGILSGLLGIGSGAVKVIAMDHVMGLPFKVSTTTSNFMIGVTAAASAGIYLGRGYIDPGLAMPVVLGVLCGSLLGARFLAAAGVRELRVIFAIVIFVLAVQMLYRSATGTL